MFTKASDNHSNPKFGDCFVIPVRHKSDTSGLIMFKVMMLEGEGDFDSRDEKELTQVTISKAKLDVMKYSKDQTVHELVLSFPARLHSPHSSDRSSGGLSSQKASPTKEETKQPRTLKQCKSISPVRRNKQWEQDLDASVISHAPQFGADGNLNDCTLLDLMDELKPSSSQQLWDEKEKNLRLQLEIERMQKNSQKKQLLIETEERKQRIANSHSVVKDVHEHIDTMQSKLDSIRKNMRDRMRSLKDNLDNLDLNASSNYQLKSDKMDSPISRNDESIMQASPVDQGKHEESMQLGFKPTV